MAVLGHAVLTIPLICPCFPVEESFNGIANTCGQDNSRQSH